MARGRITISLPEEVVGRIDRLERNRSRFILEAVEKELEFRRRQMLRESTSHPHPQCSEIAEAGLGEWGELADPADEELLDPEAGSPVRWSPTRA